MAAKPSQLPIARARRRCAGSYMGLTKAEARPKGAKRLVSEN